MSDEVSEFVNVMLSGMCLVGLNPDLWEVCVCSLLLL